MTEFDLKLIQNDNVENTLEDEAKAVGKQLSEMLKKMELRVEDDATGAIVEADPSKMELIAVSFVFCDGNDALAQKITINKKKLDDFDV